MTTVVLGVAFGEPAEPDRASVEEYLGHIFYQNAELDGAETEEERRQHANDLAARRAPGLLTEYEEIGGSPMNGQAEDQLDQLASTLRARGSAVDSVLAFQFLEPTIEDRLEELAERGVEEVITVPLYPLCGPSTTVAALERVEEKLEALSTDWVPTVAHVSGWHRHPRYLELRARTIRESVTEADIDLQDPQTVRLVFSAHGTPMHYVKSGSRYVRYVEEYCETVAAKLGVDDFELGYQNHENRGIPWTQPDIEDVVPHIEQDVLVVDAPSFLHEQSETLLELDEDLAAIAANEEKVFHRVRIPHDDPDLGGVLADVVEPFITGVDPSFYQLRSCSCHPSDNTRCLNAPR